MSNVRPPTFAGLFYPPQPHDLRHLIQTLLSSVSSPGPVPKALIVPHAGYVYSGPIAASGYALILKNRHLIKKVVLLGTAHRIGVKGLALPTGDIFTTPLGRIPVDQSSVQGLSGLSQVFFSDEAHEQEHSLEVQLPFLQVVLEDFSVVPLVVGPIGADLIADVLDPLWGGDETLIVVSSDLSHYYDYETARKMDASTAQAIEGLNPSKISSHHACGVYPSRGLLEASRRHHLKAKTIDLRNSGDTFGPQNEVVGYGAFAFYATD